MNQYVSKSYNAIYNNTSITHHITSMVFSCINNINHISVVISNINKNISNILYFA
jgi:hypothetical protein